MIIRNLTLSLAILASILSAGAASKSDGSIDAKMLEKFRTQCPATPQQRALRNAIAANSIDKLAKNADAYQNRDNNFSVKVNSKGITDQKSSGRCWLFTGLNILRAQMMQQHDLPELELSQAYNFFFDQLEKANLFLRGIVETADKPLDDKMVDWLLANPINDGGQFTGISDNISKYGIVPKSAMPESFSTENTSRLNRILADQLRKDALDLRKLVADGASAKVVDAEIESRLGRIYNILALTVGQPPKEFTWTRKNSKGDIVSVKTYTPQQFYKEFVGKNLKNDFVMFMNDPSRDFYKLYEIDYDRHAFDGKNWTYINLPIEDIKQIAINSLKDSTMMYFSCDVGKFLDRDNGFLDTDNYNYEDLLGADLEMSKADRIRTHASASSHAMTLMAVDLDDNGQPTKWMVENSWGAGPNDGHLIMTDRWFDEYMFRLVADKKYVPTNILDILKQKPTLLPAWDPLFTPDN